MARTEAGGFPVHLDNSLSKIISKLNIVSDKHTQAQEEMVVLIQKLVDGDPRVKPKLFSILRDRQWDVPIIVQQLLRSLPEVNACSELARLKYLFLSRGYVVKYGTIGGIISFVNPDPETDHSSSEEFNYDYCIEHYRV